MTRKRRYWTPEEDAIMREHYPHKPTAAVAAMLPGRSEHQIYGRAWILGLGKTAEYLASDAACRWLWRRRPCSTGMAGCCRSTGARWRRDPA